MHLVAVLALEPVVPFDLSIPVDTFGRVKLADGSPGYQVRVCAVDGEVSAGPFSIRAPWGLDGLRDADTVVVPGLSAVDVPRDADTGVPPQADVPVPQEALAALREAAARGARIASICTGAFVLAAAGLLDGRRATTHWLAAAELARRYPAVDVDPDVLYVDDGDVLTSAGAAAGLDLCLHLIRLDHGSAVAADSARLVVMPLERDGGQAQFIAHEPPAPDSASVQPLLHWLEDNLHLPLTLADIAGRAALSSRTLNRRFREQTGTTPLQWLHRARLRRAQHLLETTGHPVERIAEQVGFTSPTTFRDRFKRLVGTSPARYRRTFRGAA